MACPECKYRDPKNAGPCPSCGSNPGFEKKRTKKIRKSDAPTNEQSEKLNRNIREIFNMCLFSLVPFLGLILGPIGVIRAWIFIRSNRNDPAYEDAKKAVLITLFLGLLASVTNWVGMGFILFGLFLGS